MIIAAAQTVPVRGNIPANLEQHYKLIREASGHNVQLLVFPELSITGYERELAHNYIFTTDDDRLDHLRNLAREYSMVIIAGAPVQTDGKLYIGAFVIQADGSLLLYTKQFLHDGEDLFFASCFDYDPVIKFEDETIRLAICADIENMKHPEKAAAGESTLYLASIFYSPGGIGGALQLLSQYASRYQMAVLMSNFGGDSWGNPSGGQSAFWNKEGELITKASASGEELLIIEKLNGKWSGKVVASGGQV